MTTSNSPQLAATLDKLSIIQSEYEKEPSFYESAIGVWLDEFQSRWIDKKTIGFHIKNNKKINKFLIEFI